MVEGEKGGRGEGEKGGRGEGWMGGPGEKGGREERDEEGNRRVCPAAVCTSPIAAWTKPIWQNMRVY
jgi:hypothetical protein